MTETIAEVFQLVAAACVVALIWHFVKSDDESDDETKLAESDREIIVRIDQNTKASNRREVAEAKREVTEARETVERIRKELTKAATETRAQHNRAERLERENWGLRSDIDQMRESDRVMTTSLREALEELIEAVKDAESELAQDEPEPEAE